MYVLQNVSVFSSKLSTNAVNWEQSHCRLLLIPGGQGSAQTSQCRPFPHPEPGTEAMARGTRLSELFPRSAPAFVSTACSSAISLPSTQLPRTQPVDVCSSLPRLAAWHAWLASWATESVQMPETLKSPLCSLLQPCLQAQAAGTAALVLRVASRCSQCRQTGFQYLSDSQDPLLSLETWP